MGAAPSSLSCPQSDGQNYSVGALTYQMACFNDSIYNDIHPEGPTTNPTMESCIQLCAQTDTCVAVSWIASTQACWTKNAANSGYHNGNVWGARLLTTSVSTPTSTPTNTPTAPAPASTQTCNQVTSLRGYVVNSDFSQGMAPWVYSGPDTDSHVVQNDTTAAFAFAGDYSYFQINSTGQNRNSISQLACGLKPGANYLASARYAFIDAVPGNSNVLDSRFYDLQITINGTVMQRQTISPNMVSEYYSTASYGPFKMPSAAVELGVSWGVDTGAIDAQDNLYSVLQLSPINFSIQEDVGS